MEVIRLVWLKFYKIIMFVVFMLGIWWIYGEENMEVKLILYVLIKIIDE